MRVTFVDTHTQLNPTNINHWRELARCLGSDPDIFFPDDDDDARGAKRICSNCEVREACLEYALGYREKHGVWGGLTERERRKIIRQRKLNNTDQPLQKL